MKSFEIGDQVFVGFYATVIALSEDAGTNGVLVVHDDNMTRYGVDLQDCQSMNAADLGAEMAAFEQGV